MEEQIIAIYCLCDDFIRFKDFTDWHNVKVSTAEIMTCFIVAMRFFYGNLDLARKFLYEQRYICKMITLSALIKRIRRIDEYWWHDILEFIQSWGKKSGLPFEYIVDAFPISVCRNIRISRCRIYQGIRLITDRKANTTRPMKLEDFVNLKHIRGIIETTFGLISRLLPRKIHAVTQNGFELKVLGFIVAFATNFI
jgi:hypothetical protein